MAQLFKQAPTSGETFESSVTQEAGNAASETLWMAVCLPLLPLRAVQRDATTSAGSPAEPTVVVESSQGQLRVVAASAAARRLGIEPDLNLNAAFAFSGSLRVLERSPAAESAHLEALAAACRKLTPMVSLEPPESVLLEVRASLKLFGGLPNLKKALMQEVESRGYAWQAAVAPTPLGALWLARHRGADALTHAALSGALKSLPLEVTRWPVSIRAMLTEMGIATLGECLRLPRGGFARRVGEARLDDLDRALGKRPDPRRAFEPPERLRFEIELLDATTSLAFFVDAAARMTHQLARELRIRQAQVRELEWTFEHRGRPPTLCRIELLEASADESRLMELCRDKLERCRLLAPVTSVSLATGSLLPASSGTGRLFKDESDGHDDEAAVRLVERLRGRLGASAVHGLALAAEHRPEKAWVEIEAGRRGDAAAAPVSPWAHARPLWILREPEALPCVDSAPRFNGALRLPSGPERIESGWWDDHGVSRDYFAVLTERGERLWIYRDRTANRWYLHGYFG